MATFSIQVAEALASPEGRRARRRLHVTATIAAVCPVFTVGYFLFQETDWWLGPAAFLADGVLALLALGALVAALRRWPGALASLAACLAWGLSLPSVLFVAIRLVVRFTWFGGAVGSIAEGGADSAVASFLVLLIAVPIALLVSLILVLLFYSAADNEAKLRRRGATPAAPEAPPAPAPAGDRG
jgi:hypothetical protein